MLFEIQMDMPLSFSSLNLAPVFHFEKYMGSRNFQLSSNLLGNLRQITSVPRPRGCICTAQWSLGPPEAARFPEPHPHQGEGEFWDWRKGGFPCEKPLWASFIQCPIYPKGSSTQKSVFLSLWIWAPQLGKWWNMPRWTCTCSKWKPGTLTICLTEAFSD